MKISEAFIYSLSTELEALKEDEGARKGLKKFGNNVDYFPVQDKAVILDVDTPESYKKLKAIFD